MVEVSRKAWHFRLYNWFNEGKMPRIIDLCSYCRTVLFWTPLKVIFYSPIAALHRMSKVRFYSIALVLIAVIQTILVLSFGWWAFYYFAYLLFYLLIFLPWARKAIIADWKEAKNKEAPIVDYTKKTGRTIVIGLKYSVYIPLKTIFYTMWVKMYNFHQALFWSVLAIPIVAILYGLVITDVWWKVLVGIGCLLLALGIMVLIVWLFTDKIKFKDNIVWQFLKAKKQKICPFIKLKD